MHLCSYEFEGQTQVGLVHGSGIVNLSRALAGELSTHQPMIDLITRWADLKDRVAALADAPADVTVDEVHLLAPVPRPGKVLAIGLNYIEHVNEAIIGETRTVPEHPIWFTKLGNAINGPFDPIVLPRISSMTDYEAEMVAIIGQRCRHVSREQARDVVFGYCVGNDVSVRDIQKRTSQWMLGKSFDTHAARLATALAEATVVKAHHRKTGFHKTLGKRQQAPVLERTKAMRHDDHRRLGGPGGLLRQPQFGVTGGLLAGKAGVDHGVGLGHLTRGLGLGLSQP